MQDLLEDVSNRIPFHTLGILFNEFRQGLSLKILHDKISFVFPPFPFGFEQSAIPHNVLMGKLFQDL